MIESGLILTGNDADLLRRALSEVKAKFYEKPETSCMTARHLKNSFRFSEALREKEGREQFTSDTGPLNKRLLIGTILRRASGVDSYEPC
jgi:hypothetical protein